MRACGRGPRVILSVVAGFAALAVSAAAGMHRDAHPGPGEFDLLTFLRTAAGFSAGELQRLEQGETVTKSIAADNATVAVAAAMYVAVPPHYFLEQFRRIEQFKKAQEVQQIRRFSQPPSAADLAGLTLDAGELRDARQCQVGDCAFKLDAAGIERLQATSTDDAALAAFRAHLAEYASSYLEKGNAALMEHRDGARPLAMNHQFSLILAESRYLQRHWPDLHNAIGAFSGTLPEGLDHFLYWSKEKVASRPVVSITHVIIRPPHDGVTVIATKQLYASHYTTGSLGLTLLEDKGHPGAPRTLVAYINRTRVDVFTGLLGGLKRPMIRARARSGADGMMKTLRMKLEQAFTAEQKK